MIRRNGTGKCTKVPQRDTRNPSDGVQSSASQHGRIRRGRESGHQTF